MPFNRIPPTVPTLFPIEEDRHDWTEAASLILTAVGVSYFAIHFAIAAARGLLS